MAGETARSSFEQMALAKKIRILGVIPFALGFLLLFLGPWQIGLFLILAGAICRLAPGALADLIKSVS